MFSRKIFTTVLKFNKISNKLSSAQILQECLINPFKRIEINSFKILIKLRKIYIYQFRNTKCIYNILILSIVSEYFKNVYKTELLKITLSNYKVLILLR